MGSVWAAGRPRASALSAATAAKALGFTSAPPPASRSPQAAEAPALARPLRKVLAPLPALPTTVSLHIRLTARCPLRQPDMCRPCCCDAPTAPQTHRRSLL